MLRMRRSMVLNLQMPLTLLDELLQVVTAICFAESMVEKLG